ncbi:hypothetical protein [Flavobacterium sp. N3904]|uniref:hypothetical protein n=1 Tax=Flavobacterium sp. N3904 TaxID=2986835 RepID=UPI0022248710|nr:hypothetical protein [Flavobacterium sp. N3904]
MHFRKSKSKLAILLLFIACCGFKVHSQTNSEIALYNRFDSIVGKENLGVNNGTLHSNPFRVFDGNNMYYKADRYSKGNVFYDGQMYYDVNLKYDIYRDQLILNPHGQAEYIGVNLIQSKTESFLLNGNKFVNLAGYKSPSMDFLSGYYEEILISNKLTFFIKHHKNKLEVIQNDQVYYKFLDDNTIIIKFKNIFYNANSKKEISKIFPKQKSKINDFYSNNRIVEKSNKIVFTANLLNYINGLITNESN